MADVGLLVLRLVAAGTMLIQHGLPKLTGYEQMVTQFPDLLGIGASGNLILCIFAEVVCPVFLLLGLFNRLATIPAIINMAVAFFMVHGADPFQKKELAFLYLGMYVVLFFTGSGRYSLQSFFKISAGRFSWLLG